MNQQSKTPLVFIIIVIILAAIILVKFPKDRDAINNQNPQPTGTSTPVSKLPPGSVAPGSPELLKGTTWSWEKTVMNDDTVVTPKKADVFLVTLDEDGTVKGKTDCNNFSGSYQIGSDGVITFGPLASTKMFCENSQEADFVGPISKVKNYSLDTSGNGKLLLYFNEGLMILNSFKEELM